MKTSQNQKNGKLKTKKKQKNFWLSRVVRRWLVFLCLMHFALIHLPVFATAFMFCLSSGFRSNLTEFYNFLSNFLAWTDDNFDHQIKRARNSFFCTEFLCARIEKKNSKKEEEGFVWKREKKKE